MGAHVSASPNHQTLRRTDLESRFNVAAFGVLGYEMDLSGIRLSPQFSGTGFSQDVRVLGDFGSRLYHIVRIQKEVRK